MNKFAMGALALGAGFLAQGVMIEGASAAPLGNTAGVAKQAPAGVTLVRMRGHGGPGMHSGRHLRGGYNLHGGRHHGFYRGWRGPRVFLYGGGYGYGYGRCYWLKERAIDTGSRYWWRRYWRCRNGW